MTHIFSLFAALGLTFPPMFEQPGALVSCMMRGFWLLLASLPRSCPYLVLLAKRLETAPLKRGFEWFE